MTLIRLRIMLCRCLSQPLKKRSKKGHEFDDPAFQNAIEFLEDLLFTACLSLFSAFLVISFSKRVYLSEQDLMTGGPAFDFWLVPPLFTCVREGEQGNQALECAFLPGEVVALVYDEATGCRVQV